MESRLNHKTFAFFALVVAILMAACPSFADTTKFIYDEVNRVIRVESDGIRDESHR